MEDLLFSIDITQHILYLSLILLVIGNALKEIPFIKKWMIIWILIFISVFVQFIFVNVNFKSLFEALISVSLSNMLYQVYKQTKRGIREIKDQ